MKIAAIAMARVICFINVEDLNPRGHIFYPDLAKDLAEAFRFQKSPQGLWEFNLNPQNGVVFEDGKVGEVVVQKFSIYNTGFVLDTLSSTTDSEQALIEILAWGVKKYLVNYDVSMIKKISHYSQIIAYLDLPLDRLNPALAMIGKRVSEFVDKPALTYETSAITLSFDPTSTTLNPGTFVIEKRAASPYSENRYFCGAPLRTEQHKVVLEEFESAVIGREPSRQDITSVLSDASKSVSFWMDHADSNEMKELQKAADTIRNIKQSALKRQQAQIS